MAQDILTYQLFRYAFIGTAIACGVCIVLAVVLFFTLNIPKVASDLSGRTARKAIENIRRQNEQSGDKTYQSSAVNRERGKLTDKITRSGRLVPNDHSAFGTGQITEKIAPQQLDALENGNETTLLNQSNDTTLLSAESGETAVLNAEAVMAQPIPQSQLFEIEYEITYIHTNEVII